jgi:hypothetical protein
MLPELKQAVALVPASMVVEAEMAAHKAATQAAR